MRERHTSHRPFSAEELEQLAKLEAMSDDDIDTSDIPELPASAVLVSRGSTVHRAACGSRLEAARLSRVQPDVASAPRPR
jgi:hypothetical protein